MLEVLRTLQNSNIRTEGDLLFIGSVGEEGNGDLRGGKYLFSSKEEHIDGFISVDSACVAQLLHGSTGSRRFRVTYEGPGGTQLGCIRHSQCHARIRPRHCKIADLNVPETPKTTFTVGTVVGGSTVNSIAAKATMEIDYALHQQ